MTDRTRKSKGMTLIEARVECERWLSSLKRAENKSIEMQKIAVARRLGEIDEQEGRRRVRALDNYSVTVFDGANLEKAVRVLLKHIQPPTPVDKTGAQ